MAQFRDEEPTSGFVRPDDILKSERFTDFSVVPSRGYSLLVRAKRNGRWWMLKGLKEQYRQDTPKIRSIFLDELQVLPMLG